MCTRNTVSPTLPQFSDLPWWGSWHHHTQTQGLQKVLEPGDDERPLLSFAGYCTRLFKYFNSSKPDTYRALCYKTAHVLSIQILETLICSCEHQTKSQITLHKQWYTPLMLTVQILIYQLCIFFFISYPPPLSSYGYTQTITKIKSILKQKQFFNKSVRSGPTWHRSNIKNDGTATKKQA